ncbi:LysR substrate-binding domain-containing protein [Pseudomonas putida]|jgi:LysR family glycine cleavage system transcriptional activator|uniref:LysR substrate-binding domain-containing protein n=1 Tax=Pseudomonas putida TaxID=303 RepID=UPI002363954D|nr:LysR substrate-binding domain-containing protein [Pseudomonas putida]MDD1964381.1 LysR substrate-binding domain-containing protein [Pseudomonas putida]
MPLKATRRLPSLIALRAFDALVRQGSTGAAALELHVTHSAISHQIKKLEEELEVALVERNGKGVHLTSAGRKLSQLVNGAFEQLRDIQNALPTVTPSGSLRIACAPALLARISGMLERFLRDYPEVSLHLLPIEHATQNVDMVISFGDSEVQGQRIAALGDILYFPVCSPRLLNGSEPLRKPRDLARQVLLHEDDGYDWSRYFLAAGIPSLQGRQNIFLPDASLTIGAAIAGVGITISDHILAGEQLAQGTLIRLFDIEFPAPHPYFIIMPPRGDNDLAKAFADWLMRELELIERVG